VKNPFDERERRLIPSLSLVTIATTVTTADGCHQQRRAPPRKRSAPPTSQSASWLASPRLLLDRIFPAKPIASPHRMGSLCSAIPTASGTILLLFPGQFSLRGSHADFDLRSFDSGSNSSSGLQSIIAPCSPADRIRVWDTGTSRNSLARVGRCGVGWSTRVHSVRRRETDSAGIPEPRRSFASGDSCLRTVFKLTNRQTQCTSLGLQIHAEVDSAIASSFGYP
jgi:hypothetical protein